jgi:hypothetical protein
MNELLINVAELTPALAGRPDLASTTLLSRPRSPQPVAPGTANVLSTTVCPLNSITGAPSAGCTTSPFEPVIGAMPAGGAVVPVVR